MSWRLQQLKRLGLDVIEQDLKLIEFVLENNIATLIMPKAQDQEYFQQHLPNTKVTTDETCSAENAMVAFLILSPVYLEHWLTYLRNTIDNIKPRYIYVAVNKYVVSTEQTWPNLTNNYDQDLLDTINNTLIGYRQTQHSYIKDDRGQYFNFVHPTTNAYYERR